MKQEMYSGSSRSPNSKGNSPQGNWKSSGIMEPLRQNQSIEVAIPSGYFSLSSMDTDPMEVVWGPFIHC